MAAPPRPLTLIFSARTEADVLDRDGLAYCLLHGYGDTADCWRRVLPALQRRRRVIAIDTFDGTESVLATRTFDEKGILKVTFGEQQHS